MKRFLFFILFSATCFSQQNFVVSGKTILNTSRSVSYSTGQVFYQYQPGSITQGLQHTSEIFLSVPDINTNYKVILFPNPATNLVNLQIEESKLSEKLMFYVVNISGQQIAAGNIKNVVSQINLEDWSAGTYLLHIQSQNILVKTFKIIKN